MVHEHEEGCGCCGDHDDAVISIEYEDGTVVDCEILGTFEANGKEYVALVPQDSGEDAEDNVLIYKYAEADDDSIELIDIEDEEEFNKAAEVLDRLLNEISE
jgi:Protein of unknown function (DUF1292).